MIDKGSSVPIQAYCFLVLPRKGPAQGGPPFPSDFGQPPGAGHKSNELRKEHENQPE